MRRSGDKTQFKLTLHGISLELTGERTFVEKMYRTIMTDIEVARSRARKAFSPADRSGEQHKGALKGGEGLEDQPTEVFERHHYSAEKVIWLHRCTPLVHKIYMSTPRDLRASPVLCALDLSALATLYMEEDVLDKLLPRFERGQTLWAELTRAGKEKIAQAKLFDTAEDVAMTRGVAGSSATEDPNPKDS